jgi:cell division protein FtsI (penicillin-binding protein 3)
MTIGYGLSVTTLQLARAYLIFANQGKSFPVSLLRLEKPPAGKQIIQPAVVNQMTAMMEEVVQKGGTAPIVNIPGYRIAAKTGTAHIASGGKYLRNNYNSSFVGIAPMTNPRLVIAVVINDPHGKFYYGGYVSGPVFSRIMEGALRIMDVPPDDLQPA